MMITIHIIWSKYSKHEQSALCGMVRISQRCGMFTPSGKTLLPIMVNIGDSYVLYGAKISPEFQDL